MVKKVLHIIIFFTCTINSFGQTDSLTCNPNPFVANTTISYYTVTKDTLTISIYNQWGTLIYQPFVDSIINTGAYSFAFIAGTYPDGIYLVQLKNKSSSLRVIQILKTVTAGISQIQNPIDLKIYPCPTVETIKIETSQKYDLLRISSIDNKLVKEINNAQTIISVADWDRGIYLLTGFNKGNYVFTYKISVIK